MITAVVAQTLSSICFFESARLPFRSMKSACIGAGPGSHGDSWRPVRAAIESGVPSIVSAHLSVA